MQTDFLDSFDPITLPEMDAISLMNRIDSKYVTDEKTLGLILADAAGMGYRVLETEGCRLSPYDSIYYDTADLRMFLDHHNRRLTRQKVRTRSYVNSGAVFLEIKKKNNRGRTKKKRIALPPSGLRDFRADRAACAFLNAHSVFREDRLFPVIETLFCRITLVNPAKTERLTIDTSLYFKNIRTGCNVSLSDAVIIELKQDGRTGSPMKRILLSRRVKPVRISKYCMAVTLTDPSAKSNRFKIKVRQVEKIIRQKLTVA